MVHRHSCGPLVSSADNPFARNDFAKLISIDDGEGVCKLIELTGCMLVTALEAIDKAGELKQQSRIRDLGLVMSLYLEWAWNLEDYGIGEEGECGWRKDVVAYAR